MTHTEMAVQRIRVRLYNEFFGLVGRPEIAKRFIQRARELCVRFALTENHTFKARLDDNGAICDIEYYNTGVYTRPVAQQEPTQPTQTDSALGAEAARSPVEPPNVHAGAAVPESPAAKIPVDEVRGGATGLSAGQVSEGTKNENVPLGASEQTQDVPTQPVSGPETEEIDKRQQDTHPDGQITPPVEEWAPKDIEESGVGDLGTHREAQGVKEADPIAQIAPHVDVGSLAYLKERLGMRSAYHIGTRTGGTLRCLLGEDIDVYGLGDRVVAEDIATRVFSYTIGEELDEAMMPSMDVALAIGIVEELDDTGFQNLMQVMGKCKYIVIAPPAPEDGVEARVLEGKKYWIAKFKDCGYVYRQARTKEMRDVSTDSLTSKNGMIFERRK